MKAHTASAKPWDEREQCVCSIEFGCGSGKKPKDKTRARIERPGYRILTYLSSRD